MAAIRRTVKKFDVRPMFSRFDRIRRVTDGQTDERLRQEVKFAYRQCTRSRRPTRYGALPVLMTPSLVANQFIANFVPQIL